MELKSLLEKRWILFELKDGDLISKQERKEIGAHRIGAGDL